MRSTWEGAKSDDGGTTHPSRLRALRVRHYPLPVLKAHAGERDVRYNPLQRPFAPFAASREPSVQGGDNISRVEHEALAPV